MGKNKHSTRPEASPGGRSAAGPITAVVWLLSPLLLVVTVAVLAVGYVGTAITGLGKAVGRGTVDRE